MEETASLSIKDRIAALKAKESQTVKPEKKVEAEEPAAAAGASRRPSIADRIAAMKVQSAASSGSPSATSPGPKPVVIGKVSSPTPAASSSDSQSAPTTQEAQTTEPQARPESTPEDSTKPKLSIADRIAAMKQSSAAAGPSPVKITGAAPASSLQSSPTPPYPPTTAECSEPHEESPCGAGSSGRRSSTIADRIAALKASGPAAASGGVPIPSAAPNNEPKRRLSTDRATFANSINLACLNPGAPRPMMFKPPSDRDEDSQRPVSKSGGEDNGEMNHVSGGNAIYSRNFGLIINCVYWFRLTSVVLQCLLTSENVQLHLSG